MRGGVESAGWKSHDQNAIRVKIGAFTVGYLARHLAKEYQAQIAEIRNWPEQFPAVRKLSSCSAKIEVGREFENRPAPPATEAVIEAVESPEAPAEIALGLKLARTGATRIWRHGLLAE